MQFLGAILLLLSTSLTYARVLTAHEAAESSPGHACNGSNQPKCQPAEIETISSHQLAVSRIDNASDMNGTAGSRYKTVIPDLTALGYEWEDQLDRSYLEYTPGIVIDELSVPDYTPSITITQAYNKDLDANPKKVPLRDILLSFWQYKKGKKVADLEYLFYENVIEEDMRSMLPEVYTLLGRNVDDDKKNFAQFDLNPRASGGEQTAYFKLLNGCPFPNGANKMLREYAEFGTRPLGNFEFRWMGGDSFNFVVYFWKV